MKTIFVAFPTMHDSEATDTIKDIFENAEYPERVNLSVYNLYINESNNNDYSIERYVVRSQLPIYDC